MNKEKSKNIIAINEYKICRKIFKAKKNKGITLISLILTVIIMLIISSVGVYVGMSNVKHSRLVKFVSYMQIIQKKVDLVVSENNYNELGMAVKGHEKQNEIQDIISEANLNGEVSTTDMQEYRYFNKQALLNQLGLDITEKEEMEIVINFNTREVISLNGIEYNSKMYYTQYLLPTGQKLISEYEKEDRELSFNIEKNNEGLKTAVVISNISITNGMLSYKEKAEEHWKIITNYTTNNSNEQVLIMKSGTYVFRLTDNNNSKFNESEIDITLVNPPILGEGMSYIKETYDYSQGINSEAGAVATDGTKTYVWVPRFAYQKNQGTTITRKFIKGVSNITTYNEKIQEDWVVPKSFSNELETGYLEKTGIWVLETKIDEII